MSETIVSNPKMKTAKPTASFEAPQFDMPKFEIPKMEVPAAFREFAEKGIAQAKDGYEKIKAAAEETTDVLQDTYSTATKGASEYGSKMIEFSRANTNSAFDFFGKLLTARFESMAMTESNWASARSRYAAARLTRRKSSPLSRRRLRPTQSSRSSPASTARSTRPRKSVFTKRCVCCVV